MIVDRIQVISHSDRTLFNRSLNDALKDKSDKEYRLNYSTHVTKIGFEIHSAVIEWFKPE